jgi:hypothetical protein
MVKKNHSVTSFTYGLRWNSVPLWSSASDPDLIYSRVKGLHQFSKYCDLYFIISCYFNYMYNIYSDLTQSVNWELNNPNIFLLHFYCSLMLTTYLVETCCHLIFNTLRISYEDDIHYIWTSLLPKLCIKFCYYLAENNVSLFKDEIIKSCLGKEGVLVFGITRNP